MKRKETPKDRGIAKEHLRALSNQAWKAWGVRTHGSNNGRCCGGAATAARSQFLRIDPLNLGKGH